MSNRIWDQITRKEEAKRQKQIEEEYRTLAEILRRRDNE